MRPLDQQKIASTLRCHEENGLVISFLSDKVEKIGFVVNDILRGNQTAQRRTLSYVLGAVC